MGIGPAMPKLVVGIQPKHVAVGYRSVRPAPPQSHEVYQNRLLSQT